MMTLDDALEVLSDEYRRSVVFHMAESEHDYFTYEDITEALVEEDVLSGEEIERFQVQLAHVHLPKMEETGLVEQDMRSGDVRYTPSEGIEDLVEDIIDYEEVLEL